nr:iron-containing redox enzyme family protein [Psychromonas ingrahamii]
MYQSPIFAACQRGEISLQTYHAFLTQAYHHVKQTVPLLMACGSRLCEDYEWLRYALAQYIEEEKGHQEWILNDITACGFDAEIVRNNEGVGKIGTAMELMVAYLYHQIDRKNPLAFLGMVWVLEGTSVNVGGKIAELVQHKLDLPDTAMSYLTSHSTLDQKHIKLFASLMNKITDKNDQQAIIDGANMVFKLYGEMLNDLSSNAIEQIQQSEFCHEA